MCVIIFTIVYNIIFFFYLGFLSRTFIHESQGCRGRGRAFFKLLTTTSTRFTGPWTLPRQLLQGAHLCTQLTAGLELGIFSFRAQVANH